MSSRAEVLKGILLSKGYRFDAQGKILGKSAQLSDDKENIVRQQNPYEKKNLKFQVDYRALLGQKTAEDYIKVGKHLVNVAMSMSTEEYNAMFSNTQPVERLPGDEFLRNERIEGLITQKVGPDLFFLDRMNRIIMTEPAKDISWARQRNSPDTDPLLKGPKEYNWGDEFPRSRVSDPEHLRVSTSTWAQAIEFDYNIRRYMNTAVDTIDRRTSWVAQEFVREVNTHVANVLANDFDPNQVDFPDVEDQIIVVEPAEPWSSDLRNPIEDIRDGIEAMENNTGTYFSPTTLLLHNIDFRRLMDYFTQVDHVWSRDPTSGSVIREIDGVNIIKVPPNGGLPQGSALLLDESSGTERPLTVWHDIDPAITQSGLLHVRQYENPENMNRVVLFHMTFAAANRNQKAVCHISGI